MSYILDKKIVKDTEEFSNSAYGITLPIQSGGGTMFNQSYSSFEAAKSNLKNLLLTNKGERPFQPNFGTGLASLLFEPLVEGVLEEKLESAITTSVNYWLPYIDIDEIEVQMTDEMKDLNRAVVKLLFSVGGQFESQELTFNIEA
jgi:phage baseplate assembly protein W